MSPEDQLQSHIWKELHVSQLIRLCRTNKFFTDLCKQESFWQYLLKRDYNIDSVDNPRKEYVNQLLRKAAYQNIKDTESRLKLTDLYPTYSNTILRQSINSHKFSESLLGIDIKDKYFNFFDNIIGITARDELIDLQRTALRIKPTSDITLLDVLIAVAHRKSVEFI